MKPAIDQPSSKDHDLFDTYLAFLSVRSHLFAIRKIDAYLARPALAPSQRAFLISQRGELVGDRDDALDDKKFYATQDALITMLGKYVRDNHLSYTALIAVGVPRSVLTKAGIRPAPMRHPRPAPLPQTLHTQNLPELPTPQISSPPPPPRPVEIH